jgi:hypothetical protein
MTGASQGPEEHDDREPPARAQDVHQLAAARVHERVGDQERGLQLRELLVADGDVGGDGQDGHGQGLAVQVADGDGDRDEQRDPPAQRHHSSTTSDTA